MSESGQSRGAQLADQFEASQEAFITLIESLTDEQWLLIGRNFPDRLNEEDEGRTVGVIAHHVAISGPFIIGRIQSTLAGRPMEAVDFQALNAAHAAEHRDITRDDVLRLLRTTTSGIAGTVRAIPDEQLAIAIETAAGPMTVEKRMERVLIGHVRMHQGSIEQAIS